MGDLDQAMAHYESAMALCRKAGYKPELAWSCFDYAATLLERNDAGDRARAVAPLEEPISISSELLIRPLADRLVALQEKMESTPRYGAPHIQTD